MGYEPRLWHDAYLMLGGAAAALTGLVFVALSIHLPEIGKSQFQRDRSHYLTFGLIYITVIAMCVLMPGQSDTTLGVEILIGGLMGALITGIPFLRTRPDRPVTLGFRARLLAAGFAVILDFAAGVSLIAGRGGGLYLLTAGLLLALVTNISAAWALLVGLTADT